MQIISREHVVMVDVDETLILTKPPHSNAPKVFIDDPLDDLSSITVYAHEAMIRLVEEELHRGSKVVVWSRGGYEWAASVLTALGLDKFDILVMSKPLVYFDDLPIEKWLPYRVYLEPGTIYKK